MSTKRKIHSVFVSPVYVGNSQVLLVYKSTGFSFNGSMLGAVLAKKSIFSGLIVPPPFQIEVARCGRGSFMFRITLMLIGID